MISPIIYPIRNPADYAPAARGEFFYYQPDDETRSYSTECREVVEVYRSRNWRGDISHLGFRRPRLNIKRLNAFFALIAPHTKDIVIHATDQADACVVDVPYFWRRNAMRRGFFTLFLRMACVYFKGDLDKAIRQYALASRITPAIKHFLAGNTILTAKGLRGSGIVDHFRGHDKDVGQMLKSTRQAEKP